MKKQSKIPRHLDRRVKVTEKMAEDMRTMYAEGKSLHAIAEKYLVARVTVRRYVQPGYVAAQTARRSKRKYWLESYDRERNTATMRKYRQRKRQLEMMGILQ